MMGGTRFIGLYLARQLVREGHDVTLFTRGKSPITTQLAGETDADYTAFKSSVKHIKGDRMDFDAVKEILRGSGFQAVYDVNGREGAEVAPVVEALGGGGGGGSLEQYLYCSSAGVYLKSDQMPHREEDATDVKSRHKVRWWERIGGTGGERAAASLMGGAFVVVGGGGGGGFSRPLSLALCAIRRFSHLAVPPGEKKQIHHHQHNRASSTPRPTWPSRASRGPRSAPSTSTAR